MRIVHFAVTPLAGAPLRIVQAINAHTEHSARLVDLCRYGTEDFGQDVVFSETPELVMELVEQADIIHFHNYLDLDNTQFAPIDFRKLQRKGKLFIRHFHSHPELVASRMGITAQELLAQDIPALVIAQFQERFYPKAYIVPNFIPEDDPLYMPAPTPVRHDVFFSPTNFKGAWDCRWNTKAAPQTQNAIMAACKQAGASWVLVHKTPLYRTLALKQASRIVVDDLTTGSYHLTGLEALSQGKPVLAYLDERTSSIMQHFSGTAENPFINIKLEDALPVLNYLLSSPDEAAEIGAASREFMQTRWRSGEMVQRISEAYAMLAHDPTSLTRQPELALGCSTRRFFALTLPDIIHTSRKARDKAQIRPQTQPLHLMDETNDGMGESNSPDKQVA
ncbi:glycosyltransferase family 1 protein [Desulfovibrio mangrovi]|uniref:glycosyltransferase n=1 Tax=Desulfovibrio mangrovi TaxID=2976983 RepID=UPI0022450FD7|nr:glycosyltransferase family 1 protein [Desulfovibrio mangrovi]UZP66149.1 glycosyltransferase family 1 protein [Desulfovibrio mangrovi]